MSTKINQTNQKPNQQINDQPIITQKPTAVMKAVATKAPNQHLLEKSFTPAEIEDILWKQSEGDELTKTETRALREKYRDMKRWALEKEKTNNQQIICVPCITDNKGFYKLFEISALYYVYRLADKMQRSANIRADNDTFLKATHTASLTNIAKFVEQMKQFENPTLEITEDGIHIFTLQRPLSDDEIGSLRLIEQERRDRLHNMLRPRAMDPATYQQILMVVRQVAPKVRKLDRQDYYLYGEEMLQDLSAILQAYFDFTGVIIDKRTAGTIILRRVNHLLATLGILSEVGVWDFGSSANIGENINELKKLATKNFKIRG